MGLRKDVEINTAATATSDAEVANDEHHLTTVAPKFHYFLNLQGEIRALIYHDVTACDKSGHLNLFDTCKQMRNEGAEVSARHCTFTLWLGFPAPCSEAPLGLKATALIQNVYLEICLRGVEKDLYFRPRPLDCKMIEYFGGSQVMRESCRIVLFYGYRGYLSKSCASTTLFKTLRQLTNFRSVVVETDCDVYATKFDPSPMITNTRMVDLYAGRVNAALETALGPAKLVKGREEGSQALLFHPFEWSSRIDQHSDLA